MEKRKNGVVWYDHFIPEAQKLSEPELALKMISTIDPRGWPHITMISFNYVKTPDEVVWGQFTAGTSKKNVLENPKQGVFYMNTEKPFKFVQGKMDFDHTIKGGEDCEKFSRTSLLRYMTYTNVHTAYYNKVKAATDIRPLSFKGIIKGLLANLVAVGALKDKNAEKKLPDFGFDIINRTTSVKLLSWIDSDGYPLILPVMAMRAPDKSKVVFPFTQFHDELSDIPVDSTVAIYVLVTDNLELTNIHINGTYLGTKKVRGNKYGIIDITEIYNSMPPLNAVIYPELEVKPKITTF